MTDTFDAALARLAEVLPPKPLGDVRAYRLTLTPTHAAELHNRFNRLAAAHAAELAERDARIAEAQETNRRLNRRVQMAEAAIPSYQKLIAIPPDGDGVRLANGSMGRALLTWCCEQLTERAEAAERDARSKQARIDALMLEYCPEDMTPEQVAEWKGAIATTEQADED